MIKASMHHSKSMVPVFTLEPVLKNLSVKSVKLLKLEAEGAEPEVLEGAEVVLSGIQYITADLGPGRGYAQERTVETATNYLLQCGFDLLRINCPEDSVAFTRTGVYRNRFPESTGRFTASALR